MQKNIFHIIFTSCTLGIWVD